jgi:hypothetical protein
MPGKKETFKEAFRAARNAGVRYFYWNGKKYTTRYKEEDADETVYDDKKKYPDRNKTWGEKKDPKVLDYIPQTQQKKKGGKIKKKRGGKTSMYKKGGTKRKEGGFLLEPPIERI